MEKNLLEAGQIVSTHGVKGDVRVQCWCDSPDFLMQFDHFYIGGQRRNVLSKRVHSNMLLVLFEGVSGIDAAMALKNSVISLDRDLIKLPEGRYFVTDLIGLSVFDRRTNRSIGRIREVLHLPASDVYVVKDGENEYMIPAAGGFIENTDIQSGMMYVNTIKGMLRDDED